ncbi:HAD family hydrolase [Methylogaea oryzae]|uniref:Haloacid dehalogenase n=1 Tax=Methylogaea oryzae TaxID=1295382 RepID=A0A8D4VNN7_9GAMM|nr:hypothetical protein [Methylogaea oryzae]BBL69874.1 haloacid dehalogenase [Methylogaea oryzae]
MNHSIVYALDFDGVICDSALETGISGWKAACRLWGDMPRDAPADKVEAFRQVRPVIETGYEAILAMRMLHLGASVETLFGSYATEFQRLMREAGVDSGELKALFGATRDEWIAANPAEWIRENSLYPGMAEKLAKLGQTNTWYVVTTKQERFVKMILSGNRVELPDERIFGLDRNMSKAEVLKLLLERHPGQPIRFVEDRLLTLVKVSQEPALAAVELLFGMWGYNTEEDQRLAQTHEFKRLQLDEFLSDLS